MACITGVMLAGAGCPAAQEPVQTFTIREGFGVAHPDEIIDFDLPKPVDATKSYLLGPDGKEVPYQLLDGGKRLALRTDLPANADKTWQLVAGRAPAAVNTGVKVVKTDAYYEITNELIGIRLPLPTAAGPALPAPVQGVRYRDGQWTATGPNLLATAEGAVGQGMTVRFLEQGPLKVKVEIAYQFARPEFRSGDGQTVLIPAGEGFYRCTIEVQAGQPSVLFEEDADTDVSYSFDLYAGLAPTQARYRGHLSRSAEYGYMGDHQQYNSDADQNPAQDAFVDLQYDHAMRASYTAGADSYRYMAVWDPWVFDSGWYWQLYNAEGPDTANLVGFFAGPASRALGCSHSGVGLFTNPEPRQAGLTVALNRRSPDKRWYPRVRFDWGLFLGVKGQDLKPSVETQTVNQQMDLHGGINLNKVHRYLTEYPDPPQGYGAIYLPRATVQRMIERLRNDEEFHRYCYTVEPSSRPLIDLLTDATGAKAHAAAQDILTLGRTILNNHLTGNGIHAHGFSYWEGGQTMAEKVLWIDCLLASGQLTQAETAGLKALPSAFGNILWDDDFVPLFTEHGLNLAQGPVQYLGFRSFFAMYLSTQPIFKARMAGVEKMSLDALPAIINEQGAGVACPHYMGPYVATTLNVFEQLHQLGGTDYFKTQPRLKPFGEFYMNFLTPPEPRFGGVRKNIAVGNSATESSELCGVLATAFQRSDQALSARLMGAWKASGRQLDPRFGSCLLRIDFDTPDADPKLGSATFPGYYSVLRQGWGTNNETAVWFINGDYYAEHRHPGDGGEVVIYALGAPLALDFGSMYSQADAGEAKYHSVVQPAGRNPLMEAFETAERGGFARTTFDLAQDVKWTRAVSLAMLREDLPVIAVQDAFAGGGEQAWQLNLMADGALETPEGPRAVGQGFTIPAGVTRLGVTGQTWKAHVTQGIDWEVYLVTKAPQQAEIAESHHNWAPNVEQNEFREANGGGFQERQYLLRVKSGGPVRAFIVPFFKGQKPADLAVRAEGDNVVVTAGGKTVRFAPNGQIIE